MSNLEEMQKYGKVQKYLKDSYLFQQGDQGDSMYVILSGRLQVLLNSAIGGTILLSEIKTGNFTGEMSILENQPRSASVVAMEDSVVLSIYRTSFARFISSKPEWTVKIMQSLSNRIRKMQEKLAGTEMSEEAVETGFKQIIKKSEPGAADAPQSELYPQGHQNYQTPVPLEFAQYIFPRKITCPVCDTAFDAYGMKTTKLRLKERTKDFREIFEGFDKIWYNVWACPYCYYANFHFDFLDIENRSKEKLLPQLLELKRKTPLKITNLISTVDDVFQLYYLAVQTKKLMKKMDYKLGKVWLNLAWLYKDMQDEEMFKTTYHTAYETYSYVLQNTRINLPQQEEQRLFVLLGELAFFEGNRNEAFKYMQKGIQFDPKSLFADQARDRILDMKSQKG